MNILITGAAQGIGFSAAQQLVKRGARVIVATRNEIAGKAAVAKLGAAAAWVQLDLNDAASVDRAAKTVGAMFPHLDVLVNNAAVLLDHYEDVVGLSADTLRATLETNVIGTLRVTQAFLPLLRKAREPRIINISSGAGQLEGEPQAWAPAYSISKTALNMLTQQLTVGVPDVITNSMCPGWCRTNMGGSEAPKTPDEGADTLVWLALDAPGSLRGQFVKDREPQAW